MRNDHLRVRVHRNSNVLCSVRRNVKKSPDLGKSIPWPTTVRSITWLSEMLRKAFLRWRAFTILSQAAFNAVSDITPAYTPAILLSGLALAGFCTVIPSLLISEAISRLGPGKASAISGIGPVSTALLAVVILHEPFGWPHALALVMTMTGIAILSGWNPLLTFSKRSSV